MSTFAALFALLTLVPPAAACPTVVNGRTDPLSFDTAQVAIVREGNRTTFSVSINPLGNTQGFALVLPVPEVLEEAAIRTLDPELFEVLDRYSAPRHVSDAGCSAGDTGDSDADTDADSDADADADDTTVDVEAEYLVGEYQITILSAEESTDLKSWLDGHGYFLPDGAEPRLAEYIDGGSYFLAAKVADTAVVGDGSPLSPLQLSYESEVFSIPIRLATLNSPGVQDMVIYAVTPGVGGRAGIANYPEFEVPDTCVWGEPWADDFGAFYRDLYQRAWAVQDDAAWAVEYAGGENDCSPCTVQDLEPYQLLDLGFSTPLDEHYLTRIHMRYTPEQADQDLTLYASGIRTPKTTSYADDYESNACVGACEDALAELVAPNACGCGGEGATALVGIGVSLGATRRRRRSQRPGHPG